MRKIRAPLTSSLTMLALLCGSVYADHSRGFFAGASGLYTETATASPANEDKINHTGFELVGGYKFNSWLGADARLGTTLSDRSLATVVNDSNPQRGRIDYAIDGYQSIYYRPEIINKEAKIYLLIGYTQLDTSTQVTVIAEDGSETAGANDKASESGSSYGLGVGWFVGNRVNINVEYRMLLDDSETDLEAITIGADYRF